MPRANQLDNIDNSSLESEFNYLSEKISDFKPKTIDLTTADARLEYTDLNVKSINIQTMILGMILVILITIAFIAHLKD